MVDMASQIEIRLISKKVKFYLYCLNILKVLNQPQAGWV